MDENTLLQTYRDSVHGKEQAAGNVEAATCIDCHTPHNIESPDMATSQLVITENCGNCHEDAAESYMHTYHGKVNRLGYAYPNHFSRAFRKLGGVSPRAFRASLAARGQSAKSH